MGLKRNCPLNRDRLCRFLSVSSYHVYTPRSSLSFLFRHSRNLSNLAAGSHSRIADSLEETRLVGTISARSERHDRQFVCQEGTGASKEYLCALLSEASLWYPSSCGNLTRPRDESTLRRECVLSLLLPLLTVRASRPSSLFFLSDGEQDQPEPSNLCPKTEAFFRQFQTYSRRTE